MLISLVIGGTLRPTAHDVSCISCHNDTLPSVVVIATSFWTMYEPVTDPFPKVNCLSAVTTEISTTLFVATRRYGDFTETVKAFLTTFFSETVGSNTRDSPPNSARLVIERL